MQNAIAKIRYHQLVGQLEAKTNTSASEIVHQVEGQFEGNVIVPQVVGLFQVPWSHHRIIMDRVDGNRNKALFFVRKTIEEGWSRAVLDSYYRRD